MATRIQHRRDTAANFTSVNPVLAQGELGYETDTGKFKLGNGTAAWNALAYHSHAISEITGLTDMLNEKAPLSSVYNGLDIEPTILEAGQTPPSDGVWLRKKA